MKTKIFLFLLSVTVSISAIAQQDNILVDKRGHKHKAGNMTSKWAIFLNPLSGLEPQEAALGLGVNYMITPRWDVSAEISYLFEGMGQSFDNYGIKNGYRLILTGKHFSRSRVFFYGIDARVKHFMFSDKKDFINAATSDTLHGFSHDVATTLYGYAGIVGLRLPISKNRKWALEINTGIGVKYRVVNRKNVPAGYTYYSDLYQRREFNFTDTQDYSSWDNPYFPTAIKVMFFF